ncbi:hypothetical protein U3516DRAFT_757488 [Neocallimastix sp. 'constans']
MIIKNYVGSGQWLTLGVNNIVYTMVMLLRCTYTYLKRGDSGYCKSSLVNVVCGCGLPYPTSPNLVSIDAEKVWHGSTLSGHPYTTPL